jgi:hypothetical protein
MEKFKQRMLIAEHSLRTPEETVKEIAKFVERASE